MTAGQRRALLKDAQRWIVSFESKPIDLARIFQNQNPVVLEIGFGMGETTQTIAQKRPEVNFLKTLSISLKFLMKL